MYDHAWARSVVGKTMLCTRAQHYDTAFDEWCVLFRKSRTDPLDVLLTRCLERSQDDSTAKKLWNQWQKMLRWPGGIWNGPDVDSVEMFFYQVTKFDSRYCVTEDFDPESDVARKLHELDSKGQLPLILD